MRVIAGEAKGHKLAAPKGLETRPMLDSVKENVFNILGGFVVGVKVLDIFAGSGALGIEALSRGAVEAVFIDQSKEACRVIEANLEKCGFGGKGTVLMGSAPASLQRLSDVFFDLIFVDPPYRIGVSELRTVLQATSSLLSPTGELVLQTTPHLAVPEVPELELVDRRKYGQTVISRFHRLG